MPMTTTYSGYYPNGINPTGNITITNTAVVGYNPGTTGSMYGVSTSTPGISIINYGGIDAADTAVNLLAGGYLYNSGQIVGRKYGVYGYGPTTVQNNAFIYGQKYAIDVAGPGTVTNSGALEASRNIGIYLQSTGTITNTGYIFATTYGIYDKNAAATVTNSGYIAGYYGGGVYLAAGGSVTNLSGGKIFGGDYYMVHGYGVFIGGGGTVTNAGSITASTGVYLLQGASLTNQYGGSIYGAKYGVISKNATDVIVNAGTISSPNIGVYLVGGGALTNTATGTIAAAYAVYAEASATIINAGAISSSAGAGVYLAAGGKLTNASTGTITGSNYGVYSNASTTIVNAGTITGSYAVKINGTNNLLVIDPGAVFNGKVLSTGTGSTIELASAASAGTIASIGSGAQFTGFSKVDVDAGAKWTLLGASPMVFLGGGGDALTVASAASLTITAGVGMDTVNLGTGVAALTEAKGSIAGDVINGFTASDVIHFTGFTAGASVTEVGNTNAYTVGTAASHETINVNGVKLGSHYTIGA